MELIGLPYSPWTERARWALDHHGIAYKFTRYNLLVDEPALRARLRVWTRKVTVPVLIENGKPLFDSLAIAKRADALGDGPSLFPEEHLAEIDRWVGRIDEALEAGRALVTLRTAADQEATEEMAPGWVPSALRRTFVKSGTPLFALKYRLGRYSEDQARAFVRDVVREVDRAIDKNGGSMLGTCTFADIAAAAMLQMVKPVDDSFLRLKPGMRRVWTNEELAAEVPKLLAWRDEIYASRRSARSTS